MINLLRKALRKELVVEIVKMTGVEKATTYEQWKTKAIEIDNAVRPIHETSQSQRQPFRLPFPLPRANQTPRTTPAPQQTQGRTFPGMGEPMDWSVNRRKARQTGACYRCGQQGH